MRPRTCLALAGGAFLTALASLALAYVSNDFTYVMLSEHLLDNGLLRVCFGVAIVAFGAQAVLGYKAMKVAPVRAMALVCTSAIGGGVAALFVLPALAWLVVLWALSALPLGGN